MIVAMGVCFFPSSVEEAVGILAREPCTVIAGCTDLYAAAAGQSLGGQLLDVTRIPGMRLIETGPGGVRIGAAATWAQIARNGTLGAPFEALRQAARGVGGRQVQEAGTVAGNLCNASPAADGVPPLLVLDAEVELTGPRGPHALPLADFIEGPRRTARAPDEIVTAVRIPADALAGRSSFLKLGARRHLVISIAMVAVRVNVENGQIARAALAVGACGPVARRLPGLEAALAGLPVAEAAGAITDAEVRAALSPIDDLRATAEYRSSAAAELLRRALAEATA
jgi:CO/xanthine dehydrogenase FAD-binding subunit